VYYTDYIDGHNFKISLDDSIVSLKDLKFPSIFNGNIDIDECTKIESLEGLPDKINGSLYIGNININSLLGCPSFIRDDLTCYSIPIVSLDYLPEVGRDITFSYTKLHSLKGIQKIINGSLTLSENRIKSAEYFPKKIKGNLILFGNKLDSLSGITTDIGKKFLCLENKISKVEIMKYSIFSSATEYETNHDFDFNKFIRLSQKEKIKMYFDELLTHS
jgi:hypothetical protein